MQASLIGPIIELKLFLFLLLNLIMTLNFKYKKVIENNSEIKLPSPIYNFCLRLKVCSYLYRYN
jgi:hypothetical protein